MRPPRNAPPRRSRRGRRLACAAALGLLAALFLPLWAQDPGVELSGPVETALGRIQEQWLQWIGAFYQDDADRARGALDDMLATAQQLGFERLPDLSFGALARGAQSAREGAGERALWALAAAERLDPGRPEAAFAAADAAWATGAYGRAFAAAFTGWARVLRDPLYARLALHDLALWATIGLLLAGMLFVAVEMVVRGPALVGDLVALLRFLPAPLGLVMAIAVLLWPLALPAGPAWLALYWSALLFAHGSWSERVVFVLGWMVVAGVPLLLAAQQRPVAVSLSPAMRAARSLADGRLHGSLFADVGALRSVLPEAPAVAQLVADLHRHLGQWEDARALYTQVVEKEPNNHDALIDLGAYAFRKGDFGNAVKWFQQAATAVPTSAAAFYNLSLAYSESYLFDDSSRALQQAQQIDNDKVSQWIQRGEDARVLTFDGGFGRVDEIERLLGADRGRAAAAAEVDRSRRWVSLGAALGAAILGVGFLGVRRQLRGSGADAADAGVDSRVARILIPGVDALAEGHGLRGYFALLFPSLLLAVPLVASLGYPVPWGYQPIPAVPWAAVGFGLVLFYGVRARLVLGGED